MQISTIFLTEQIFENIWFEKKMKATGIVYAKLKKG